MKRRNKVLTITAGVSLLLCGTLLLSLNKMVLAQPQDTDTQGNSYADRNKMVMNVDKEGNVTYEEVKTEDLSSDLEVEEETTYKLHRTIGEQDEVVDEFDTYEEANAALNRQSKMRGTGEYSVYDDNRLRSVSYGVVNFRTKPSTINTYFTEDSTGISGYTNGSSAADGAFLGTNSDGSMVKFKMAGVTGWVKASDVQIIDYDNANSVSFYRVESGRIYHYVAANISSSYYPSTYDVGPKQSYMKDNVVYYSYDGHYFYTSYNAMINDYKNGTYRNAINPDTPYYNYFQYITQRTKTNFSASDINNRVQSVVGNKASALKNEGNTFVNAQNTYGANALLTFGLAVNESGWGQSNYALNRNNIFGHAAFDSNPDNATSYKSVADSINQHTKVYVSESYLDPHDFSGRYHGGHLGDKKSGMNVSYASDPYWGEKAAAQGHYMDRGRGIDQDKYKLGIKAGNTNVPIYKEPNTNSKALYNTGVYGDYPFIILGTVSGSSVNGNTRWYKIQSDTTLTSDRNNFTQDKGEYDFGTYYAYVNASYVNYITTNGTQGGGEGGDNIPPESSYKKGDVNGDGKISSMDYALVKNHILGISTLSGNSAKAADVNGDGKISSMDYALIKNDILGISKIN